MRAAHDRPAAVEPIELVNRVWLPWNVVTRVPRGAFPGDAPLRQPSPAWESGGSDGRFVLDALFGEQRLQLARLEHLHHDVAAADELALDVELRDGGPLRELLDALAQLRILQHVRRLERHAQVGEDLHHARREPALREHRGALHVEHYRRLTDLALDAFEHVVGHYQELLLRG